MVSWVIASRQKLEVILENKVVQILKFSKNLNNKKCVPKMIFFNEKKFRETRIIGFESQNFTTFDNFYSIDRKTWKRFWGAGKMCDSVR